MTGFEFIINFNQELCVNIKSKALILAINDSEFYNTATTSGLFICQSAIGDQIILNPRQCIFRVQRNFRWDEIENLFIIIQNIADCMLKDIEKPTFLLRFVNIREWGMLGLETSKSLTSFNYNDNELNDIIGLGFRFFIKNSDKVLNEFKLEPLIADTNMLFIEGLYNYNNFDFKNISISLNEAYNNYNNKTEYFLKNLKNELRC